MKSNQILFVLAFLLVSYITSENTKQENTNKTKKDNKDNKEKKEEEELVVDITPRSFYDQVKKYGKLIIYFYSKTCGHCQTFEPIYKEVAKFSKDKNLGFGFVKIDGPGNEEFSDTFKLTETPSLFYVEKSDGQMIRTRYEGRRSVRALTRYLTKKHSYRSRELTNYKSFTELVKKSKRFMIFFGDKTIHNDVLNKFISAALDHGIENIFWTKSAEFYDKYNINKNEIEVVIHTKDRKSVV